MPPMEHRLPNLTFFALTASRQRCSSLKRNLFLEVFDDVLLVAIHPACHTGDHKSHAVHRWRLSKPGRELQHGQFFGLVALTEFSDGTGSPGMP